VDYSPDLTLAILREPSSWDMLQVFVSGVDEEDSEVDPQMEPSLGKIFFAGLQEEENVQVDAPSRKRVVYDVALVFGLQEITVTQAWEFT